MNGTKLTLLAIGVLGIAGVSYMISMRNEEQKMKDEILSFGTASDKSGMLEIIDKMSYSELSDTLTVYRATKEGKRITDLALKVRLMRIGKKYNIFT